MVDNSKVSSYHKNYNNNNTWKEESYHNNNRKCSHQQYNTNSTCNSTNNRTINNSNNNNNSNKTKVPDTTTRLNIVTTATRTATSINHTKLYCYNRQTCPKANWLVVVSLLVLVVVLSISFSSLVDIIVIDIVVESFQLQQQQQRQRQVTKSLLSTISSQLLTTSSLLFLSTAGRSSSSSNSNSRNCNRLSRTCTSITPFGIIGSSTSTSSTIGQRQGQLHQPTQRERLLTLFLVSSVPVFDSNNDDNDNVKVNVKMTTTTTTLDSKEQSGEEITNNTLSDNGTSSSNNNNNNDAIGTTKSNKRQLEEEQGDSSSTDSTTTTSNTKKTKENSDNCTVILVSDTSQPAPIDNDNDNDNVSTNNHNNTNSSIDRYENIKARMVQRINGMNQRAKQEVPLTEDEINDIISSIQALSLSATTTTTATSTDTSTCIDYDELRALLVEVGHVSHKNWTRTGTYGRKLGSILRFNNSNTSTSSGNDPVVSTSSLTASASSSSTTSSSSSSNTYSRTMLRRILTDGNWDGAVQHTIYNNDQVMADGTNYFLHPWVVLVTGVNGIRKTTSIYQSWFPKLLQQALVGPVGTNVGYTIDESCLPVGTNSFFRQLDHIIATVCNKDFNILYQYAYDLLVASSSLQRQEQTTTTVTNDKDVAAAAATQAAADVLEQILQTNPPSDVIKLYSDLKASIFTRYRTISELLGAYLLYEAQKVSINCMLETSGRDVAMFHYVDHFFPSHTYKKLVLHFTINDLSYAQESVDTRMINEIHSGIRAITSSSPTTTATTTNSKNNKQQVYDVQRIIQTNLGGPYGSDVLPSVQRDSDTVWESIIQRSETIETVGQDWYKASIQINAHPIGGEPWTAQAILPDGTLGTKYTFT